MPEDTNGPRPEGFVGAASGSRSALWSKVKHVQTFVVVILFGFESFL